MNPTRRLSRNPWVNCIVLGMFVLWSGMFVCLLPNLARLEAAQAGTMPVAAGHGWRSDCLGSARPTFCISAAHDGLLSSLHQFAAVSAESLHWVATIIPPAPARIDITTTPRAQPFRIFLLACVFLK